MRLEDLLTSYAVEAGVIVPSEPSFSSAADGAAAPTAGEILQEEAYSKHEETLPDMLDHAEKAADIAEQMDDLAARANDLADEDRSYARSEVAIESLHREFRGLMRAHRLTFKASSFENAYGDVDQLRGIANDATRVSRMVSDYRRSIFDYSSEGDIAKFLRRDESKLKNAKEALQRAEQAFKSHKASVAKGVVIKNNGVALFMTVKDQPVRDLKKAVAHDAAWLENAHSETVAYIANVLREAGKVKPGGNLSVPALAVKKFTTAKGALLGNRTVNENLVLTTEPVTKADGVAIAGTVAGLFGTLLVGMQVGMRASMTIGGPAGFVAGMAGSVAIGQVGGRAINAFNEHRYNKSDIESSASASDLEEVAKIALGFERFTKFTLDVDAIDKVIKQLTEIDSSVAKVFETAISSATRAVDLIYDHAFFLTVNIANLLETVVKADKE